jgi:hypothetical protein
MAKRTHEEIHNIPDYKGNAKQNHVKIPPHSSWNDYHQEHKLQPSLARVQGKKNTYTLLVEM